MRVIHNNLEIPKEIKRPKTYECACEHCNSVIEVEPSDLYEGWLGAYFFTCPVCGKESMADTVDSELPTKDNIEFPKHFNKSSVDNGAVDIKDEEIQDYIRSLCNKLWNKTNEREYMMTGTGNMVVFVENYAADGVYKVTVCKNYWEGEVKANPADEFYRSE